MSYSTLYKPSTARPSLVPRSTLAGLPAPATINLRQQDNRTLLRNRLLRFRVRVSLPPAPEVQAEVPDNAGRKREAQPDRRAELQHRDIDHGNGETKPDQAPAAVGDHGCGR